MGEDGKDWPGIVGCKGCIQLQRDLVVARDAFLASREENDRKAVEIARLRKKNHELSIRLSRTEDYEIKAIMMRDAKISERDEMVAIKDEILEKNDIDINELWDTVSRLAKLCTKRADEIVKRDEWIVKLKRLLEFLPTCHDAGHLACPGCLSQIEYYLHSPDAPGKEPVRISQQEWEQDKAREKETETHPCDNADPDKCMCKGACGCHWKTEAPARERADDRAHAACGKESPSAPDTPVAPGPKDEDDPCGDCGNSYSFEICNYCLRLKLHPIRFSTMKDNWRPKPSKSTEETPVAPADKKGD